MVLSNFIDEMALEMNENKKSKSIFNKREQLWVLLIYTVIGAFLIVYGFKFGTYIHVELIFYALGTGMIIIGIGSWIYEWFEL